MNRHDEIRAKQARICDRNSLESLSEALLGLQSTDDSSLVPLYKELSMRYADLKAASSLSKESGLP